ncbi:hypothetical protein GPDM_01085 [Planococcus donghaensis MPA1U2]|uniref:DUF4181 domain-containing protein n=1 Tax=Planococcus donghaensis MPA1U2 TaxID=933115 RepID=E7RCQ3_9BACL|nr:DUF4181 domain-containing protein [Planococcus donghaensis]EGA91418.1 hypothetical protein GPDM_01085 [Planococcus donghaensis MPA1U2]
MFWLKLSLFLFVFSGGIWLLKWVLRKIFNIEKPKREWFSYNHINKLHEKVDRIVRIVTTIVMLGVLYTAIYQESTFIWFLVAWFLVAVVDYSVRAFFEWKYSDHPKEAILTLGELGLLVIVTAVVLQFDLLNIGY